MRYPQEFHDFMRSFVPGHHHREVAEEANKRFGYNLTASIVKSYCQNHHIKNGLCGGIPGAGTDRYPKEVYEYIISHCKGISHADIAKDLNRIFGTDYTKENITSFYKNHDLHNGFTGRFEKGHVSPCRFKKGEHPSLATEFKKGHVPANRKPIGSERISRDGYVEIKVRKHKTKEHLNTYDLKQRVVWEKANGKIPDGMMITFLDGNRLNCELSNLALITNDENRQLNLRKLRSNNPELTKAGIGVTKLVIRTKELKRGNHEH